VSDTAKFKTGDVVKSKLGGVPMTVDREKGDLVAVCWFDEEDHLCRSAFFADRLELVKGVEETDVQFPPSSLLKAEELMRNLEEEMGRIHSRLTLIPDEIIADAAIADRERRKLRGGSLPAAEILQESATPDQEKKL